MFKYNPFKWHVVETPTGKFAVRKMFWWFPFVFMYADAEFDGYVWLSREHASRYASVDDVQKAIRLAQFMTNKDKVVRTQ